MQPSGIPTVDPVEAERRLREDPAGPILLDVREINEFEEVRAPGAVLIPTSTFMTKVESLPTERPLMVVCHMGGRSAAVAGFLIRSGRNDVVNVAGGMEAWERAGLPVRRGRVDRGCGEARALRHAGPARLRPERRGRERRGRLRRARRLVHLGAARAEPAR